MGLMSANPFPSMLYVEGTTPTSPSAGQQRLFVRSSDHVLCMVNSSGAVTPLSGALTNPMSAKGDIILGDTGGTPTRLAAGTAGYPFVSAGAAAFGAYGAINAHGARVKRASGDVNTSTEVMVGFTAEDYDTDTMHDNSTNPSRLTIPTLVGVTTGLWAIKASGYVSNNAAATVFYYIYLNGSTRIFFSEGAIPNGSVGFSLSVDWVFTAADYVELAIATSTGTSALKFDATFPSPVFSIAFLGKVS